MSLAARQPAPKGAARAVVFLTVGFLGALAFAIPPAPVDVQASERRGYVESFARFSDRLADLLAAGGYSFLALDLASAPSGSADFWKTQLARVQKRRFKVWGWLPSGMDRARAEKLVQDLNLEGLFVGGPDAAAAAAAASSWKPGLPVLEVVDERDPRAPSASCVAMSPETFAACFRDPGARLRDVPMKVLRAGGLDAGRVLALRAGATGDYLVLR